MRVVPAIDLINGACVRLVQGDFSRKTEYSASPIELATEYAAAGATRLHLVDLDGAKAGEPKNLEILTEISKETDLVIDWGGGLKQESDLERAFEAGADMVVIGSLAVRNPEKFLGWVNAYCSEKVILAADVRDRMIAVDAWEKTSKQAVIPFLREFISAGVKKVLCTEISRDGMLTGAAVGLYQELLEELPPFELIASGGIGEIGDLDKLADLKVSEVVVGKALLEGRIQIDEIGGYLA